MQCPMCEAENGSVAEIVARGYHCTACNAWPNSTWWYRAERRRDVTLDGTFARFRVGRRTGTDPTTAYYEAVSLDTGEEVELRVYLPWVHGNEELVARFARTSALHRELADPRVRPVISAGTVDGLMFAAVRPARGEPLTQLLARRIERRSALALVRGLCGVFEAAHRAGLAVHAELTEIDVFALALALAWRLPGAETTESSHSPGELDYMSPEQIMGKPTDARSDVYALGVLAYEVVTGQRPFADARDPVRLVNAQLKRKPQPPSELAPDVSSELEAVILRCLEKDKQNRFPELGALAAALS